MQSHYGQSYAPSYDLKPKPGVDLPACEVDFVFVTPRNYPDKTEIVLGECKDEGGMIDAADIDHLGRIANAFPSSYFKTYIVLAKLSTFTPEEIELAKTLNGPYRDRVILLTERELEPHLLDARLPQELQRAIFRGSAAELAGITRRKYFGTDKLSPQAALVGSGRHTTAPPAT